MKRGAAALLASLALILTPVSETAAFEVCRYAGTATHSGHIAAKSEVSADGGTITVDVTLVLTATILWVFDVQYLVEEISVWRAGELQQVAANIRYGVNGQVKRQQWDVFKRTPNGLEAYRVLGKTLADFRLRHPSFVRHWEPATFGQPWLPDYAGAAPERRPDLDLPAGAASRELRTPLAVAFYWSRFLPLEGGRVPVFLPGFKRDARTDLAVGAATPGKGWRSWQVPVRHAGLSAATSSTASVWVSEDERLLQLAFEVHALQGSAQGLVRAEGCQGGTITP